MWSGRRRRRLVRRVRRRRRVDRVRAASSGSGPAVSQLGRRRQRPLQVCCRLTQPSATVARAGAVRGPTPMGAARDSDLTISSVECLTRGGSPSRAWASTARAACHQRAPRASARVSHADARGRAAGPLAPPPPPPRRAGRDAARLCAALVHISRGYQQRRRRSRLRGSARDAGGSACISGSAPPTAGVRCNCYCSQQSPQTAGMRWAPFKLRAVGRRMLTYAPQPRRLSFATPRGSKHVLARERRCG